MIQQRVDTIKKKILSDLKELMHESIDKDEIANLQLSLETFIMDKKLTFSPKVLQYFDQQINLCASSQNNFHMKKLSAMEIQTLSCKLSFIA